MALEIGSRLGHYDVTALIGEGGMGEVYQATDTQLNRQVALKILPEAFATDPDRLARFQREAQVLASLNHPGIAAIYGIEEAEGTRALVLELVEGPTLADRIAHGPIPLDDALPIAKQIAEAVEAAHEAGVIHRDLKPANIKVREDGTVKVLDFGLAKALDPNPTGDPSQSPTLTAAATQMGVIMGTAAYMSPEQASGETTDKRSDIWSFGVVLFEMLTGQRVFTGKTISHVLSAVLQVEPKWDSLPITTPQPLTRLLRRCLEKEPKRRLRDVSEAVIHLEEAAAAPVGSPSTAEAASQPAGWRQALPLVLAASLIVAVITGLAVWSVTRPAPPMPPRVTRFSIALSPNMSPGALHGRIALSPSGTHLVYALDDQLYLRAMDQRDAAPIRGTEGALEPFFSPDGQWVGFFADGQIKRVAVTGGAPVALAPANAPYGPSWSVDDTILFGAAEGIFRVAGAGGTPELISAAESGEAGFARPQLLPGGERILFTTVPGGQVVIQSLVTGERRVLIDAGVGYARYVPTGHLVYVQDGTLLAVPFDPDQERLTTGPVPLVEGISQAGEQGLTGLAQYAYSDNGTLVFVPGSTAASSYRLSWVDLQGEEELLDVPPGVYSTPQVSPDGTRVAMQVTEGTNSDIWVADVARGSVSRVTTDPGLDQFPIWTPDGQRVVFTSSRDGARALFSKAADGTGEVELLRTFEGGGGLAACV